MGRPVWFRVVTILLLLWNAAGVFACVQQFRLGAEALGRPSEYDRNLFASLPVWYNAVYAVATGCGFLAALALLARSVLSIPLFAIALIAVALQFGWLFATTDIVVRKGAWTTLFPMLIVAIALFSLWLARSARRRGWIA